MSSYNSMPQDLTVGSIPKTIFKLAWPMSLGIFAIMGFNLVDTYFVGQVGTNELAAISLTFPVVMVVGSLALGIGTGLSSIVAREVGRQNFDQVRSYTTDALIFSLAIVALITPLGLLTMDSLFKLLGAKGEVLELVKSYMGIWYLSSIFIIVPMVGNGAIRGTGDTKMPSIVMIVASFVNFVFDPLLIFGLGPFPQLGLKGAAIATALSRICTLFASLYILHFRLKILAPPLLSFKRSMKRVSEIIFLSAPIVLGNLLIPISIFVITALVADYGKEVIAGFGVGTRIESITSVILMGISSGLGPFVGQNYGAGRGERIRKALKISHLFSFTWTLCISLFTFLFVEHIARLFSNDPQVIAISSTYLKIIVTSLLFSGIFLNITSTLNAMGHTKHSMLLNIIRMFVLYIPLAFTLRVFFQEDGIFYGAFLSNTIAGIFSLLSSHKKITIS